MGLQKLLSLKLRDLLGSTPRIREPMTPEISEFSYGFALTNEIVGWAPIGAAPVFPSLIEEGRTGGGYDVRLHMPGVPVFIQFKRADCMTRSYAREIRDYGVALSLPFYRFRITESGKSNQHELLLALNEEEDMVFYAAPRFHRLDEINAAWNSNQVASRSIFVTPAEIGKLDDDYHHVAYDDRRAYICSEPKRIDFVTARGLIDKLRTQLSAEREPFGDKIANLARSLGRAKAHADERGREARGAKRGEGFDLVQARIAPEPPVIEAVPTRAPRPLSGPEGALRKIADDAAKIFNAQLVIAQKSRRSATRRGG